MYPDFDTLRGETTISVSLCPNVLFADAELSEDVI